MAQGRRFARIQTRNGASFRRHVGQRPARQLALLVCEDEKIAPTYFRALCNEIRVNTVVQIPPNTRGSAPISVVEFAVEKYLRDGKYDHTFCIFDRDEHESYDRALRAVGEYSSRVDNPIPLRAITSVPCFELWFLLHFEPVTRPMRRCEDVIARIQRHVPGYEKGADSIIDDLLPRTDDALRNARLVRAQLNAAGADNPLTNVDRVVEQLRRLATTA